ncbi:uncharacterized protein [Physcomitrium patens]|uniref:uncharacterized protein n=1 Tax=Physcomitrium patens TaxID=3218 RepID=UPI000D17327B|nr:uncharacterized protein LOC112279135 [Physcomitrium patens]XP_024369046.1 uncharacterized protein LOC112279135 [Physcomitrium patens]|eukprot:XP_024369045.1 uncharacterized protein LOC112279135 [Physcomitrella patens]
MFLESGYERVGASRSISGGVFPTMDSPRCNSAGEEDHQRAAVEFVMELAGKHTTLVSEKIERCHSLVYADQIPVPMFNVDFNLRCLLWNKRAADLTGWPESEIFAMPRFHDVLFSSGSSYPKGLMKDVLKVVLDGHTTSQEVWDLKTKWGEQIKVLVVASPRMDAKGVVSGAICVIMPYGASAAKGSDYEADCNLEHIDEVTNLDLEGGEYRFLTVLEKPLSPYLNRGERSEEMFAAQKSFFSDEARMQSEEEGTSACCQGWCNSNQGSPVEVGSVGSINMPSSSTRVAENPSPSCQSVVGLTSPARAMELKLCGG